MSTVLVVEDDPTIARVLEEALQEEGYVVETAVDGQAVWSALSVEPAVILLDINMPGMDGIQVARRLRADARTKRIPIILMSAAYRLRERAREAPVDALLPKPFDLTEMLTVVERLAAS
jgi:CheY-like chemotaxis protein